LGKKKEKKKREEEKQKRKTDIMYIHAGYFNV